MASSPRESRIDQLVTWRAMPKQLSCKKLQELGNKRKKKGKSDD
jgi:hypothetical protein